MKISKRISNMQESPIRKLTPYAEDAKNRGIKIHHLNIGQPDVETPEEFFEPIRSFNDVLEYTKSQGIDELIESFRQYYRKHNIDYEKEDIVVTFGGTEALIFSMLAVCDVEDEIIVPEPLYTSYNGLASMTSIKIAPVPTKAEEGFHLPSFEEFTKAINPRTKAILISNPGNPTGRVYTEEEMNLLARIVKEYDLYLFADEVYREFIYDSIEFKSFAHIEDIEQNVILIDSISKRYSACGARIGSVASKNKDLMKQMVKLAQGRVSPALLDQLGAANLNNVSDSYLKDTVKEYEERRNLVYGALNQMKDVICEKPQGAFYVVAKLPVENSEEFIIWLLKDFHIDNETVMLSPVEDFYATKGLGKDEVRISYCINQESLAKAMRILDEGLKEYRKTKIAITAI